jgi:hypothetical protein
MVSAILLGVFLSVSCKTSFGILLLSTYGNSFDLGVVAQWEFKNLRCSSPVTQYIPLENAWG